MICKHPFPVLMLALSLGVTVMPGCIVSPIQRSVAEERLVQSGRFHVIEGLTVPAVLGAEGCGAQALATILAHQDPRLDPVACAEEMPWHDYGATPVELLLEARERGFDATIARGALEDLAGSVDRREPLLVMLDAGPVVKTLTGSIPTRKVMHWAVLSGYALDGTEILLATEGKRHHVVDLDDFIDRWEKSAKCTLRIRPRSLK